MFLECLKLRKAVWPTDLDTVACLTDPLYIIVFPVKYYVNMPKSNL